MKPVGILGGGQLARMIALAGHPLGLRCRVLEPGANPPAAVVAEHVRGALDDPSALARFADGLDLVTCEIEHLPDRALDTLKGAADLRPNADAVRTARDRLAEKTFLRSCGAGTADFVSVDDEPDLERAAEALGFPFILKTRVEGYDGRGQARVHDPQEAAAALAELRPSALIAEAFVEFDRELSLVAVRSHGRECAFYPLVENHHAEGILRWTLAPAPNAGPALQQRAEELAKGLMVALDYVGVLTIELFQVGEALLVNEIAPRVHNSGHWSIEGAETSQFENHLRAVVGMPLGATTPTGSWVMFNLLGETPDLQRMLSVPDAHVHLYGKDPRPGRKLGHVTCRSRDPLADRPTLATRLGIV